MPKRICVIEADRNIRDAIGYVLRSEGYSVFDLAPDQLILRQLQEIGPHLIIMDVALIFPLTVILSKDLKQEKSLRNIPLIHLTTSVDLIPIKRLGADKVIQKPFNFSDLLGEVSRLTNK